MGCVKKNPLLQAANGFIPDLSRTQPVGELDKVTRERPIHTHSHYHAISGYAVSQVFTQEKKLRLEWLQ